LEPRCLFTPADGNLSKACATANGARTFQQEGKFLKERRQDSVEDGAKLSQTSRLGSLS
jgi:hypothetical protein